MHVFKTKGIGGCERLLFELLPALRTRGVDARTLVLSDPSEPGDIVVAALRDRGVPTQEVPIRSDWDPGATRGVATVIKRARPDLVHTHLIHGDIHGVFGARLAGVRRIVGSRHNLLTERRHRPHVQGAAILATRATSRVITVSDAVAAATRKVEWTPERKIRRIYSGVRLPPPPARRPAGTVGAACRLVPEKDIDFSLRAWAALRPREHERLRIAGHGPARAALHELAKDLGIQESVDFLGLVVDIESFYREVSIFAHPSRAEGLGLATIEAAAAGLPVVATRTGGVEEAVLDRETGFLVSQGDVTELARALRTLLDDPAWAGRMGAAGRTLAETRFSFDAMVDTTLAVYDEVLAA